MEEKKQIITIAGRLGSGKSSTAKLLAEKLGYVHFSSGDLFREIAAQHGHDILTANKSAENDYAIDHMVDQRLRDIGETGGDLVIDSRTAWHWVPKSFKVYLHLDTEKAAERILAKMHERAEANEHIPEDPIEYSKVLDERYASENRRYETLYSIDPSDETNYDLVIDTDLYSLDDVVERIYGAYMNWLTA